MRRCGGHPAKRFMGQQQVHYVGTGNMGSLGNAGGDGLVAQVVEMSMV
ncbi:hypothetical protein HanHA89_Chr14g0561041 [Helianthus annuus]|nr:hypothetical protein HanHA89_Chr14g0561041 [Helianthus annuus]